MSTQPTMQQQNGTAIEKAEPKKPTRMELLKGGFEQWRPTLKAILPKHIDPDRVIKIACNVFLNNPSLQTCSPLSMIKATLQCAELGLEPSPLLGEAYFIPFKNKKKVKDGNVWKEQIVEEVQLMPGYVGIIKVSKQTGEVADVYAVVVDEAEKDPEHFQVHEGTDRRIHHVKKLEGRTGKLFAAYGVVKFKDGTCHFEVMSKDEIDAIRARSKSADNGPWVTDYNAMAKKTMIKQALKTVPKSPEKPQLAQTIAADNAAETSQAFSTDLSAAIDADGESVPDEAPAAAAAVPAQTSRTSALSSKLDEPPHDPATGELKK